MISLFRGFAKSRWAAALFVLLIISFLVVGGRQTDILANFQPRNVIDAGKRSLSPAQFRADFERVRDNLQKQAQRPVTIDDMVAENLHTRYLESETQKLGFLEWADRVGIRTGKELVLKQIRDIPAFFNQVTGQFSQEQYEQVLAQQNMTPPQVEQELRDNYVTNHIGTGLFAGVRTPRIYGALLASRLMETRDGRWFLVTQQMAGRAPAPTDAQLNAFMTENAAQLRQPEFRIATVVLFNPAPNSAPPAISEDRIKERFEFRKASLSEPEKRTFVTLTAPTKAAADRIAAALRAGQSAADAGKTANVAPAQSNDMPQSAVADPPVGQAVFGMTAGQVSDPIQGRVGFTVAQLTSITPGHPATLESARDAVIAELRDEDAKTETYSRVEKYEKARGEGKSLDVAAREVGARLVQLPPFTEDGKLPDGQPMNAPPLILSTAYSLAKGGESEVVDAGQGQYFALRVDNIRPAAVPPLDEVREPLAQRWTQRENARLLSTKAEALAAQVRSGKDIAEVAAAAGARLVSGDSIQESQQSATEHGQGVVQGLFSQGRNQVFSVPQAEGVYAIGRVEAIHPAVPALAAPMAQRAQSRLDQDLANAMTQAALDAAAARVKAHNDPALAREALGLEAEPAAPAP